MKKTLSGILGILVFLVFISFAPASAESYDSVVISGKHVVAGNEGLTSVSNTYVLTGMDNAPMPKNNKVTASANSEFRFDEIRFTQPGIYEYKLSREKVSFENIETDDSVYIIRIGVFSDGSNAVVYEKEGHDGKEDSIVYTDTYLITLTYLLNGGNIDGDEGPIYDRYTPGQTVTLRKAPVKDGYKFLYWKGSRYDAEAEYFAESDHTFEAIYEVAEAGQEEKPDIEEPEPSGTVKKPTHKNPVQKVLQKTGINTGENGQIYLFGGLFAVAIIMLIVILLKRRFPKKENKENEKEH